MKRTLIDPPSGWLYGFPKVLDWDSQKESFSVWLIRNGYPEKDVEWAQQYCWTWNEEEE